MRLESKLGPLWTEEPKTTGFRLAIPNPAAISYWQQQAAIQSGHCSREINEAKLVIALLTSETYPNERAWRIDQLDSKIFSSLSLTIGGHYSPKKGEYGNVMVELRYSDFAKNREDYWKLPSKTDGICSLIRKKGFLKAFTFEGEFKIQAIVVPNADDTSRVTINLGVKTLEDAREVDPEDPKGVASSNVLIYLEEAPLQLIPSLVNFQHFQYVAPCVIDSLHEIINLNPPNNILTLTSEQELK